MRISLKIFGLLWMSQTVHASVLYGVDQIQDNYRLVHYPAYVQVGSFSTIRAAERLKHQMHVGTNVPAIIQSSKGRYRVRLGPCKCGSGFTRATPHYIKVCNTTGLTS